MPNRGVVDFERYAGSAWLYFKVQVSRLACSLSRVELGGAGKLDRAHSLTEPGSLYCEIFLQSDRQNIPITTLPVFFPGARPTPVVLERGIT